MTHATELYIQRTKLSATLPDPFIMFISFSEPDKHAPHMKDDVGRETGPADQSRRYQLDIALAITPVPEQSCHTFT